MGSNGPAPAGRPPRVELRLAGGFAVMRDGAELAERDIGSRKSRTALKLLAVSRPALVTADQIAEVLWPGQAPDGADRNIAVLVSRLRAALGAGIVHGGRAGYRLGDDGDVSVDLDVAAALCQQAERKLADAPAVALAAAERAAVLLAAGTALAEEPYASWADPAREELRRLLRRARLAAGGAALATGDPELAIRHAGAATAADGLDEAAHRLYMSAAVAAGEPARALVAYAALRERLSAELGTDPAPQTRELHLAVLRAHAEPQSAGHASDDSDDSAGSLDNRRSHRSDGSRAAVPGTAAQPVAPHGPVLAGRDGEIEALREAWRQAARGAPSLVVITGEAGIGKTALAEFIAAEAASDGATVLRMRCYETERSLFLQPFVDGLRPVITRMSGGGLRELLGPHAPAAAALLPEAAALLGPVPPGRGSVEMERRRAFEAVTGLLRGLADRNPVLVAVDDLQYSGQSTIELLHFLGRQLAGSRLLAVATVRAERAAGILTALQPVATPIELGPLSPAAVRQLAADAGQGALAADILQRTRGHTLFVVEVLRALRGGDGGVPESLRSAVQARVRRAGAPVETLLRAAAVAATAFDPLLLAAMLDLAPGNAVGRCERALLARLLVVSGRQYEFANDLIREILYASTPEPTRLAYHRRAADLLTGQPEALAVHAAAIGDWPRAARAWLLAAEEAMRSFAAADAVQLAGRALDAAERGGTAEVTVRARVLRGRAHQAAGASADAFADFTTAAAVAHAAGDRRQEMLVKRELGGDVPVAVGMPIGYCETSLAGGLQIAESLGDRASQADLLGRLAVIAANRLQLDQALDLGLRAVTVGRLAADDAALASGLDGLKVAHLCLGDTAGLSAVLAELDPLLRSRGDLFLLQWTEFESAFLPFAAADFDEAEDRIAAAIATNSRGGYPAGAAWYTAHLGWLARLRGRDDVAVALGRRALALAGRHEHGWWIAAAAAMLGTSLLMTGAAADATELLERGLAAAQKDGSEAYLLRCLAPLAEATGSADLLAEADELLAQAASKAGAWLPGYEAYLQVARAWLRRGDPERARSVLVPLVTVAERTPWIPVLAEVRAVDGAALAALGRRPEAVSALRQAVRLAAEHGMPQAGSQAAATLAGLS